MRVYILHMCTYNMQPAPPILMHIQRIIYAIYILRNIIAERRGGGAAALRTI